MSKVGFTTTEQFMKFQVPECLASESRKAVFAWRTALGDEYLPTKCRNNRGAAEAHLHSRLTQLQGRGQGHEHI
jgi:hypothetical protein